MRQAACLAGQEGNKEIIIDLLLTEEIINQVDSVVFYKKEIIFINYQCSFLISLAV